MAKKDTTVTNEITGEIIEFKIIEVKEITAKNGNKFKAYKTVGKGGRKLDVRFVQDCSQIPKEPCIIGVLRSNANVDKSRVFPILWIKDVEYIKENERKNNLDEFFGDDTEEANEV